MNFVQPFDQAAKNGYRLRAWKNRLVPLMAWMPLTANQQTVLRGLILNLVVNVQIYHGEFAPWLWLVFVGAWLLDFTDGLTAQYQGTAGRGLGRYLDPAVDIPTSLITAVLLWPYYHHSQLIGTFFILSAIRGLVCSWYLIWACRAAAPRILPPNIASQLKTWCLVLSFSLLIISRSPSVVILAEACLFIGLVLEFFGIISLTRACWKKRRDWRCGHPDSGCPSTVDLIT